MFKSSVFSSCTPHFNSPQKSNAIIRHPPQDLIEYGGCFKIVFHNIQMERHHNQQQQEEILQCYENTFFFFLYRKFIRQGNDIFDSGKSYSLLTTLIIILWIVNVALYSVKFSNNRIIIEFNDPGFSPDDNVITIIAGWFYLTSLLLIIIATNWGYKYIVPYFAIIMFITTLVIIVLRYGVFLSAVEQYRPISITIIISTCIQAIVMMEYLWLYMLVPAIVRWKYRKWSPQKTTGNSVKINGYEAEEANDDDDDVMEEERGRSERKRHIERK